MKVELTKGERFYISGILMARGTETAKKLMKKFEIEEETFKCKNCQTEYLDSDAEYFEEFCSANCQAENLAGVDYI